MRLFSRISCSVLSVIAVNAITPFAFAADVQVSGTYSDLKYIEEAGDLVGTEITIIPQPDHRYSAMFQYDEGSLGETVFVNVTVKGNQISFTVPANTDREGTYSGIIGAKGFDGYFLYKGSRQKEPVHLKRKTSYWG